MEVVKISEVKVFDNRDVVKDAAFKELVESVKEQGILTPMLARQVNGHLEVVAGKRRLEAAKAAGMTHVPAEWFTVREMTDAEAGEAQLVENLHRADLHPIDELRGYEALLKHEGATAETIAKKAGKPLDHVRRRLALASLDEKARKAFREGKIGAEVAFQIARLPNGEDRARTLKYAVGEVGYTPTSADVHRWIAREVLLQLATAPFALDDAELVPAAGPCTTCPKRSGNQKALFSLTDDRTLGAETCLDRACFAAKVAAQTKRKVVELKAAGQPVITLKAAEERIKAGIAAKHFSHIPLQMDQPRHTMTGRKTPVDELGKLFNEHCLNGCEHFSYVIGGDLGVSPVCFLPKHFDELIQGLKSKRKAEAATGPGEAPDREQMKERAKQKAESFQRHAQPLLNAWYVERVGPALAKHPDTTDRLSLLAACAAWRGSPDREAFAKTHRFNPDCQFGDYRAKWAEIAKLPTKRVSELLRAVLAAQAPSWHASILAEAGKSVGVDAGKQLALTTSMLALYSKAELTQVAKNLGVPLEEGGKAEMVESLAKQMKAGKLPPSWQKLAAGKR